MEGYSQLLKIQKILYIQDSNWDQLNVKYSYNWHIYNAPHKEANVIKLVKYL